MMSAEKFGKYKAEVEERVERRERPAQRNYVKSEKHLRYSRGFKRMDIGMKTYSHGPTDSRKR